MNSFLVSDNRPTSKIYPRLIAVTGGKRGDARDPIRGGSEDTADLVSLLNQMEIQDGFQNMDNTVHEGAATRGAVEVRQACSHPPTLLGVLVGSLNRNARRFGQDQKCGPSGGCGHTPGL